MTKIPTVDDIFTDALEALNTALAKHGCRPLPAGAHAASQLRHFVRREHSYLVDLIGEQARKPSIAEGIAKRTVADRLELMLSRLPKTGIFATGKGPRFQRYAAMGFDSQGFVWIEAISPELALTGRLTRLAVQSIIEPISSTIDLRQAVAARRAFVCDKRKLSPFVPKHD